MKTVTDIQKSISDNIKNFRAENHMSALDLHEISGAGERSIQEYTALRSMPSLYNAYLISNAMGISVDELIGIGKPSVQTMEKITGMPMEEFIHSIPIDELREAP